MPICWHLQMIKIEKTRTQIWPWVQLTLSSHWTVPTHHIWKQCQQSEQEKKKKNRGKTLNISDSELTYSRWVMRILLKAERFSMPSYENTRKPTLRSNPASKPRFFRHDTKFNELLPFGQSSSIFECPFCTQSAAIYTPKMSRSQRFTT